MQTEMADEWFWDNRNPAMGQWAFTAIAIGGVI
jgi:hypothetical protein